MEKRLEAGWFQRIAWSVLAWGSLGLLVWVPFLYVAIRRRRGSDWGAFAAFALYECVTFPWAVWKTDQSDPVLGGVFLLCLLIATAMLLFAMFDRRPTTQAPPLAYGAPTPAQGHPYGAPYGR